MKRLALQLLQVRCCSAQTQCGIPATVSTRLLSAGCQSQYTPQQQQLCSSMPSPAWSFSCVRHMAGRTHKLSLKRANNRASWAAVRPFLQQQQQQQPALAETPKPKLQPIQSAIAPLPQVEAAEQYRKIGCITGPYSVTRQAAFAVLQSGGSQFKVTADDIIYHNKIPGMQVNDVLEFGDVLMVGTQQETTIGRPFIPGAAVIAAVEENLKDAKVHVFKKKKRKGYSKLKGHRSHITALRILELRAPGLHIPAAAGAASGSRGQHQAPAAPPISISSDGTDVPAVTGISSVGPAAAGRDSSSSGRSRSA